ncbi:alpha/beta fold hydrolase [Bosea sp. (in: a-proteobacteria)]|jgi:pimeloyl-ACP methyl ester carboxylesterase|uniref:alpha/beta fold hydrolase n=1 Tax=Bosea sp. (in: a-proteobacteria) TaxID=1871050 RepID=UPI003F71544D
MPTRALLLLAILVVAGLLARTAWLSAEAARLHPPKGTFLALPGGRLHYVERKPSGEMRGTVVLVHGASSNHADLLAMLGPELSHYRVIALDRPGHGWSDRMEGRAMADPARQAAVLMQALDRIAPERFVLVAHSLAGGLSARIALDRPERLQGLVLLGGVTHPWPGGIAWYYHAASWPVVGPLFTWLIGVPASDAFLRYGVESVFAPKPVTPGYVETGEVRLLLRPATFQANAQDVAATLAFVSAQAPRYGELAVPVVAITGDSDAIVSPVIHSASIAREAPQGRFVLLPGVGHMPHHAAPEIVVAAIDQLAGPKSGLAWAR